MSKTILLIEDDDLFRWRLLHFLEERGYIVLEAEDAFTGIKLAQIYQPDLIVCDIGMPQFDGYYVLKQLQSSQITATIPFVFLTNRDASEYFIAMKAGAQDYLSKAIPFEGILEKLLPHLGAIPSVRSS